MLDKSSNMVAIATIQVYTFRSSWAMWHWEERDALPGHVNLIFSCIWVQDKIRKEGRREALPEI